LPRLDDARVADGIPLLHGAMLVVDAGRAQQLVGALADAAGLAAVSGAARDRVLDVPALIAAAIRLDSTAVAALAGALADDDLLPEGARGSGAMAAGLMVVGQAAALPLLLAIGREALPITNGVPWEAGYCPVCAGWASLSESRGLSRERWLRCGRCGTGWRFPERCPYCATGDHRQLGYLAPEADRETRRALTCDGCGSYVKSTTTLGALSAADLALHDLGSLELDLAAADRGFGRPTLAGFPLELTVEAREPARRGWLPWRR
jgi:FdhE protein